MSKVVIIGGSGHVGTYLVPRLVAAGHDVINVSRGEAKPYLPNAAWDQVQHIAMDRAQKDDTGSFGAAIAALEPEIVIDMICFTLSSAQLLAEALKGSVRHFIHIGTIWVHGHSLTTPTSESDPRAPFGDYGVQKSQIEDYLLGLAQTSGFPATVVRPGHIVGPGWTPLNPAGHFNPQTYFDIRDGKELCLPNFGLETVHHVHADDVAQMVMRAINNWSASVGEAFNAVSPAAVTLRGFAEAMFAYFGHTPKLRFLPFDQWKETLDPKDAEATWEHIVRSPCHSIAKGQRLLGYQPRYTSLEAVTQSVDVLLNASS